METTPEVTSIISLTPAAVTKVQGFFQTEETAKGKSLRIALEAGGCSGFQYAFVFDTKKDGDTEVPYEGFSVLVDADAAQKLRGAVVDYQEDMQGAGFKISNPNVKKSCGCGSSNSF